MPSQKLSATMWQSRSFLLCTSAIPALIAQSLFLVLHYSRNYAAAAARLDIQLLKYFNFFERAIPGLFLFLPFLIWNTVDRHWKFFWWRGSICGSQVSEVTAQPTVPQPRPYFANLCCFSLLHQLRLPRLAILYQFGVPRFPSHLDWRQVSSLIFHLDTF